MFNHLHSFGCYTDAVILLIEIFSVIIVAILIVIKYF